MESNVVGWFEIPVSDMERAIKFYETVFDLTISRNQMGESDMGWFPWADGKYGSGGSLVKHQEYYKPSTEGALVTLFARLHIKCLPRGSSEIAQAC